jgi:hypothetical protein
MVTKTVQSPTSIQILFLLLLALGAVWFLFSYQYTSASNISYCDKQFADQWFQEVSPDIKKVCWNRFIWNQNRMKRQFILNNY